MTAEDEFDRALREHGTRPWVLADGVWRTTSADGSEEAELRPVPGGGVDARVARRRTGPDEPDPFLAHGPRVFGSVAEAVEYCESNLAP